MTRKKSEWEKVMTATMGDFVAGQVRDMINRLKARVTFRTRDRSFYVSRPRTGWVNYHASFDGRVAACNKMILLVREHDAPVTDITFTQICHRPRCKRLWELCRKPS